MSLLHVLGDVCSIVSMMLIILFIVRGQCSKTRQTHTTKTVFLDKGVREIPTDVW